MKYSFLMPYKNRPEQLYNTLLSLLHWYGDRNDWEVRLVVDGFGQELLLPDGIGPRIYIKTINREGKVNPAPLFNIAANAAQGPYLVLTNPECYHVANVLVWYDTVFEECPEGYAVAACDGVHHIGQLRKYRGQLGQKIRTYQHSTEHNVLYHWCSAMSKQQYASLGGFDDRFGDGYACEDDDFRDRVVCSGMRCFTNDSVLVLHQEHAKLRMTPELRKLYEYNLKLLREGEQQRGYKHDVEVFKRK